MILIFGKIVMFIISMIFSAIVIDDTIENIIDASKTENDYFHAKHIGGLIHITPVGLTIITIVSWAVFYGLTLIK